MKVNEIFESIQGEGRYAGNPVLFIRLSGCTRQCSFCDTSYHWEGKEISIDDIVKKINKSKLELIIWTGGEPLLQYNDICKVYQKTQNKRHHLETNGDLFNNDLWIFEYICISPKDLETTKKVHKILRNEGMDIKVVTDLKLNKKLIPYATMLMPLTTGDERKDKKIEQDVWNYCVENKIRYCLRQHIKVWGTKKKGV